MKYVMLGKISSDWATKQKARFRAASAKAKSLGVGIVSVHYTQGEYDFVAVVEADDVTNVLAFSLWYAQEGFGRIATMPAFEGATIEAAVKKL